MQSQRPQQNTSRENQDTTLCERVYESICIWPEKKGQSPLSKEWAGKQTGTWKAQVYMKQNDWFLSLLPERLLWETSHQEQNLPKAPLSYLGREMVPWEMYRLAFHMQFHPLTVDMPATSSKSQVSCYDPNCPFLTPFCPLEERSLSPKSGLHTLPSLQPSVVPVLFVCPHIPRPYTMSTFSLFKEHRFF